MTALHLNAQLQSLINSIPVGVCEVYTLESLIESQWPSTVDRGTIFFLLFLLLLLLFCFVVCCLGCCCCFLFVSLASVTLLVVCS